MSEPLLIVGNGMAAARLVDELAKVALGRYAIAVIGDEPRLAYNRVLLSSVLAGETTTQDIELRPTSISVATQPYFRVTPRSRHHDAGFSSMSCEAVSPASTDDNRTRL